MIRTSAQPKDHFEGKWKKGKKYTLYAVVVNNGTKFRSVTPKEKDEPYVIFNSETETFSANAGWEIVEMSEDSRLSAMGGSGGGASGQDGKDAGFGTITASVSDTGGTPSVEVTTSGPNTAKNISFAFHNIKGAQGAPGVSNADIKVVDVLPAASAQTTGRIYLVETETAGTYARWYTEVDGATYTWRQLGTTAVALEDYATEAEVSQLRSKVNDISTGKYYGYFAQEEDLPEADVDGFAYVGEGPTYTIYNLRGGVWTSSEITVDQPPIGNDEDIDQNEDGKLQFADRVSGNGMGYVILRKNKTFAEQVTETNTIYEIRYDFNLSGATVTIPSGCVLKFNGGTVVNGTINGQTTTIDADPHVQVFADNTRLSGTFTNNTFSIRNFESSENISSALNSLINSLKTLRPENFSDGHNGASLGTIFFPSGNYTISSAISLAGCSGLKLIGENRRTTIITSSGTFYHAFDSSIEHDGFFGFTIAHITFKNSQASTLFQIYKAWDTQFIDCYFFGNQTCIQFDRCVNLRIDQCLFQGNRYCVSDMTNTAVGNTTLYITNSWFQSNVVGIYIYYNTLSFYGLYIENCIFEGSLERDITLYSNRTIHSFWNNIYCEGFRGDSANIVVQGVNLQIHNLFYAETSFVNKHKIYCPDTTSKIAIYGVDSYRRVSATNNPNITMQFFDPATQKGETSAKPILNSIVNGVVQPGVQLIGYEFFDKTKGKPLYWNGGYWVDSLGNRETFPILWYLTNVTSSNLQQANIGEQYITRLTASDGYTLPASLYLKIGSTVLTANSDYTYDQSTGELTVLGIGGTGGVTDNLLINAVAQSL